jgi:hypothetical protein
MTNPRKLSNDEALDIYRKRRDRMKTARTAHESDWDVCDKQVASKTYYKD